MSSQERLQATRNPGSTPPGEKAPVVESSEGTLRDSTIGTSAEAYVVRVVEGPDTGASVQLDWASFPEAFVGTSALSELRLSDPTVSRRHLRLSITETGLAVFDLGSTNGVFLGDFCVREGFARDRDLIRIGRTLLTVDARTCTYSSRQRRHRFGKVIGASDLPMYLR